MDYYEWILITILEGKKYIPFESNVFISPY